MKINFKQIISIQNIKDLNKFKLDKPIYFNNFLFHYLIEFNKLNILKLYKFPIWKENEDGYNGIFLASKYNNIKILKYLLKEYSEYIYNTNSNNDLFINFLSINNICKIINLNLDWEYLLNYRLEINSDDTIIKNIMINGTFNQIKKILKVYKKVNKSENYCLNYLIHNDKMTNKNKIELLKMFNKEIYNNRDKDDFNCIFPAIYTDNIEIVQFLLDSNIDVDYYSIINTIHPLRYACSKKNYKIYELIWNYIKKDYNYESTNKNLDNIAHFLLINNHNDKISIEILKNCSNEVWNQKNIDKKTPIDYLIKWDFDKYNFLIKDKNINFNYSTIQNKKWKLFITKLPRYFYQNNIKFNNYEYSHANLFQAKFKDVSMIAIYLKKKYKELYLPNLDDYQLGKLNYSEDVGLSWPDSLLEFKPIFPWIICYENEEEYWIHSNLNNLINAERRIKKYDFGFCYLSLIIENIGLHANIIIWDFNNLTIERFDPYGNTVHFDKKLDDILEEELTWNTGFTYLKPSDYMPVVGFQTVSDELNPLRQKAGDYGGYCLVWCTWYLENRLINKNISAKKLVDKLLKKLSELDISFMEYIRNYANKINDNRVENYRKAGISDNIISNTTISLNTNRNLNNYIIKQFLSLKT
jgi:hypothetical protein